MVGWLVGFHGISTFGPIRCFHAGPEWTWEQWQWRGLRILQISCITGTGLYSVISRVLVGRGVLPLCRGAVGLFFSPSWLGNLFFEILAIHFLCHKKTYTCTSFNHACCSKTPYFFIDLLYILTQILMMSRCSRFISFLFC